MMSLYHINSHYIPLHPPIKSTKNMAFILSFEIFTLNSLHFWRTWETSETSVLTTSAASIASLPTLGIKCGPWMWCGIPPERAPCKPGMATTELALKLRRNYGDVAQLWNPLSCCGSWRFCSTASDCCTHGLSGNTFRVRHLRFEKTVSRLGKGRWNWNWLLWACDVCQKPWGLWSFVIYPWY